MVTGSVRRSAEGLAELGLLLVGQADVLRLLDDVVDVVDVEAHEVADLLLLQRDVADVDEQRAGERGVGAVLGRLRARRHAARAVVDGQRLELVGVLLVVGEPEVAEAAGGAGHALDDDVVVLAGLVVGPAGPLLTVDLVGEVVERAGVGPRPVEDQFLVREARVDLVPVGDGGAGSPDGLQLLDGQAVDPVVVLVHHDGERVVRDRQLLERDAVGLADRRLLVLDRTGGVGDVGLAVAELLEAAAGARRRHRDVHAGLLLGVERRGRLAQRSDRARPVDRDRAGQGRPVVA
jgi:hypothetical protein